LPLISEAHVGPPLVALVTDTHDGTPISIHKTWITPTGKADLGEHMPRKLLWNHRSDGVIRLWPNDELILALTIGEGIETCLAAALAGMDHALRAQPRRVSGAARIRGADGPRDHDKRNPKTGKRPGIVAARAVIGRYAEAGFDPKRDIQVLMPETEGHDAADLELA
jgi:hypothetical protein